MAKASGGMSEALPPAEDGLMAEVAGWIDQEGASAFSLVPRADDALKARLALIDSAVSSLDIKYFIWKGRATHPGPPAGTARTSSRIGFGLGQHGHELIDVAKHLDIARSA